MGPRLSRWEPSHSYMGSLLIEFLSSSLPSRVSSWFTYHECAGKNHQQSKYERSSAHVDLYIFFLPEDVSFVCSSESSLSLRLLKRLHCAPHEPFLHLWVWNQHFNPLQMWGLVWRWLQCGHGRSLVFSPQAQPESDLLDSSNPNMQHDLSEVV